MEERASSVLGHNNRLIIDAEKTGHEIKRLEGELLLANEAVERLRESVKGANERIAFLEAEGPIMRRLNRAWDWIAGVDWVALGFCASQVTMTVVAIVALAISVTSRHAVASAIQPTTGYAIHAEGYTVPKTWSPAAFAISDNGGPGGTARWRDVTLGEATSGKPIQWDGGIVLITSSAGQWDGGIVLITSSAGGCR
jgi:hypothetical protein